MQERRLRRVMPLFSNSLQLRKNRVDREIEILHRSMRPWNAAE
jgi:hypothetical protein